MGRPRWCRFPEDLPFAPVNPYGESKVLVEKMLRWMDQCSGLRSIALRYFNACGADPESGLGEEHEPETHLIPLLLRAVVTGKPMTIFGDDYDTPDGTCIRDYIHVTDLAEAHVVAIEKLLAGGASDVFNVGTGAGPLGAGGDASGGASRRAESAARDRTAARGRSGGAGGEFRQTEADAGLEAEVHGDQGHRRDGVAVRERGRRFVDKSGGARLTPPITRHLY